MLLKCLAMNIRRSLASSKNSHAFLLGHQPKNAAMTAELRCFGIQPVEWPERHHTSGILVIL